MYEYYKKSEPAPFSLPTPAEARTKKAWAFIPTQFGGAYIVKALCFILRQKTLISVIL